MLQLKSLLILFVTLISYNLTSYSKEKVLYHTENAYGPLWVHENEHMRCLSFAPFETSKVRQSCIIPSDQKRLVFPIQKVQLSSLYFNDKPQKILMVGLGGGTFAKALMEILPDAQLDIVEINPEVEKVAKNYFFFKESTYSKIHIMDGYAFVEEAVKSGQKYDLIFLDAFGTDYIPPAFLTDKFVSMVKEILSPQGLVVANTFVNSRNYNLETSLYKNVFGELISLRHLGNRLIFAVNGTIPSISELESNAPKWEETFEQHGVMTKFILSALKNSEYILKAKSNK